MKNESEGLITCPKRGIMSGLVHHLPRDRWRSRCDDGPQVRQPRCRQTDLSIFSSHLLAVPLPRHWQHRQQRWEKRKAVAPRHPSLFSSPSSRRHHWDPGRCLQPLQRDLHALHGPAPAALPRPRLAGPSRPPPHRHQQPGGAVAETMTAEAPPPRPCPRARQRCAPSRSELLSQSPASGPHLHLHRQALDLYLLP